MGNEGGEGPKKRRPDALSEGQIHIQGKKRSKNEYAGWGRRREGKKQMNSGKLQKEKMVSEGPCGCPSGESPAAFFTGASELASPLCWRSNPKRDKPTEERKLSTSAPAKGGHMFSPLTEDKWPGCYCHEMLVNHNREDATEPQKRDHQMVLSPYQRENPSRKGEERGKATIGKKGAGQI